MSKKRVNKRKSSAGDDVCSRGEAVGAPSKCMLRRDVFEAARFVKQRPDRTEGCLCNQEATRGRIFDVGGKKSKVYTKPSKKRQALERCRG